MTAKRNPRFAPADLPEDEVSSGGATAPEATRSPSGVDAPPEPSEDRAPPAHAPDAPLREEAEESEAANESGAAAQPEDHEHKLQLDLDELGARAEKADEYLELAQRTKADFENYRKRAAREVGAAQERGMTKLARELLPAIDNLERALAVADVEQARSADSGDTLEAGIKLVRTELLAALARVGIEPFSPEGEPFDPQRHEAVAQQPVKDAEPGTVVEVYQRGYSLGELVLRPARVVVAG
jgi:molecular chaperone GrpE